MTTGVKWLVNLYLALAILTLIDPVAMAAIHVLSLTPAAVVHGSFWQLITFLFQSGGVVPVLPVTLMLWILGTSIERKWGTRRFLRYFFLCGAGTGLWCVALSLGFHHGGSTFNGAVVAVQGLLVPYSILFWKQGPSSLLAPSAAKPVAIVYVLVVVVSGFWRLSSGNPFLVVSLLVALVPVRFLFPFTAKQLIIVYN
jgi:membrane associated rhomboid family serine protease